MDDPSTPHRTDGEPLLQVERWKARLRGVLAVVAPTLLLLAPWTERWPVAAPGPWALSLLLAAGMLLAIGLLHRRPRVAQVLATSLLAVFVPWWATRHLREPAGMLLVLVAGGALLTRLWPSARLLALDTVPREPFGPSARAAAVTATVALVLQGLLQPAAGPLDPWLLALVAWVPAWFVPFARPRCRITWIAGASAWLLPPSLLAVALLGERAELLPWTLVLPTSFLAWAAVPRREHPDGEPWRRVAPLLGSPARSLVVSFVGLCAAGSVLLALPGTTPDDLELRFVDAAFTAVSAVCVTGLVVLDTPGDFTVFGQLLILVLIQVGGLGIMTFSSAAFALIGRRMSLLHEATAVDLLGAEARADLLGTLWRVLIVTFTTEGLGAAALSALFLLDGDPPLQAAWRGVFTAISAFCNAGFALQSDSLVGYQDDPGVLLVVSALIVIGGLGPAVVVALPALARGRAVTPHVRLVVATTLLLLLLPALVIGALEWGHSLAGLPLPHRLANAWFQSVTLRTAGFNSVDLTAVQPATWTLMVILMYVGGSSGSTAGGAKITTIAVLMLAVSAAVQGRTEVVFASRRIPTRTVYEAAAIATVGVFSIVGGLIAVQLTQVMDLEVALFEVVSALGTVGLSLGGTAQLDDVGKVLIMMCMFSGRVGPVTLFVLLAEQQAGARVHYPEAHIPVG